MYMLIGAGLYIGIKFAFEALDRTLRDLMGKGQPMRGMCMLLCGDF